MLLDMVGLVSDFHSIGRGETSSVHQCRRSADTGENHPKCVSDSKRPKSRSRGYGKGLKIGEIPSLSV
jgi:hypothetical protein